MSRQFSFLFASAFLLITGLGFRWLAGSVIDDSQAIPRDHLDKLAFKIGAFSGRDIPLDERVRLASQADSVVYRAYRAPQSLYEFSVFAAAGSRPRDLAPHRPEVCYASAGWMRDWAESTVLTGSSESPARILLFTQAGLPPKRILVLNYYIVDGELFEDIDRLRLRLVRAGRGGHCWAQVQIASLLEPGDSIESAKSALIDFGTQATPEILRAIVIGPIMPIEQTKESHVP